MLALVTNIGQQCWSGEDGGWIGQAAYEDDGPEVPQDVEGCHFMVLDPEGQPLLLVARAVIPPSGAAAHAWRRARLRPSRKSCSAPCSAAPAPATAGRGAWSRGCPTSPRRPCATSADSSRRGRLPPPSARRAAPAPLSAPCP